MAFTLFVAAGPASGHSCPGTMPALRDISVGLVVRCVRVILQQPASDACVTRRPYREEIVMSARSKNDWGFTLIELLVVIAIIAILAAILFPVFARAREKGQRTACLSNMKQVSLGLTMYSDDNNDRLPYQPPSDDYRVFFFAEPTAYPNFLKALIPYAGGTEAFRCPAVKIDPDAGVGVNAKYPKSDTNYIGNGVLMGKPLSKIPNPAGIIYLQEYATRLNLAHLRPAMRSGETKYWAWHYTAGGKERYSNAHMGGGNVVYADGHAMWRAGTSLRSGDFGLIPATDTWQTDWGTPRYTAAF
jgi:prepilin-type N-terminal cleavage/methylation domain-containing protein/prepilin-type processing-associated H-X9-DG protein